MTRPPLTSDTSPGQPLVSVVIPAYNRVEPLRITLASVLAAAEQVTTEILLVDDGSAPPLTEQLGAFTGRERITFLSQTNQGAIAARLHGLVRARGRYVVFLDSDDLLHPDKLVVSAEALQREQADVVYDDMARATLGPDGWHFTAAEALRFATEPAEFYLRVQPVPHSPTYRKAYLDRHLHPSLFPPTREYDPAGDVWLYYNLAPYPAKIIKLDRALTAIGVHDQDRYSRHWERIAASALKIMEAFAAACPREQAMHAARVAVGECAFDSWRRLPRGFSRDFERRMLALWQTAPHGSVERLGGRFFQLLAGAVGAERAGRMLRLRNSGYGTCRTIDRAELQRLLA